MQQRIPVNPSISKLKLGSSIKIEPIVNPIIQKYVGVWNLSKSIFINLIQIKQPIIRPTPNGIKKGKYNVEIDSRYVS